MRPTNINNNTPQTPDLSQTVESTPNVPPSSEETSTKTTKTQDRRNWSVSLRNGLAGGIAGCAAKTVIAPLDRIRILFQTRHSNFIQHSTHWRGIFHAARDITRYSSIPNGCQQKVKRWGVLGLFKGHSATLLRIFPYAGINFLVYERARGTLIQGKKENETPARRFLAGATAGACATALTYPFDVVRVRFAFEITDGWSGAGAGVGSGYKPQEQVSWVGMARRIYHEGNRGMVNFYRGFSPTMLGILPYAGTSFLTHDLVKDFFRDSEMLAPYTVQHHPRSQGQSQAQYEEARRLTAPAQLTCGAIAGITAQTVSYPIEIIRRRMQVGNVGGNTEGSGSGREGVGIIQTARNILSERGIRGFYVGLGIGYVKMAPMVATSFFVYDRLKGVLGVGSS